MPRIECTATGAPDAFDVDVDGRTYVFSRDDNGRLVSDVADDSATEILLATGLYRVADVSPPAAGEKPQRGRKAA